MIDRNDCDIFSFIGLTAKNPIVALVFCLIALKAKLLDHECVCVTPTEK